MIRKKKLYKRPKKLYEKGRITEENELLNKYGLKNKREVWKSSAKINYFRSRAKALARSGHEEQQLLFNKLNALGIKANSIADVLALKIENLLERRLPTIVANKKLARTARQARQMVVHKNIMINGNVINSPSYIVPVSEENSITLRNPLKKNKTKPTQENSEINTSDNTEKKIEAK